MHVKAGLHLPRSFVPESCSSVLLRGGASSSAMVIREDAQTVARMEIMLL